MGDKENPAVGEDAEPTPVAKEVEFSGIRKQEIENTVTIMEWLQILKLLLRRIITRHW